MESLSLFFCASGKANGKGFEFMEDKYYRAVNELDFISVVSALAVTFLHANNCFWAFSANERYWATANIIENICYFAVPLFFMMSGINLLDYRRKYSTKEFVKKRVRKVLIPYLFWSLAGIAWTYSLFASRYDVMRPSFDQIINMLLNGSGIRYFWFFIPLFMIYFSIPFLSEIKPEQRIKLFTGYILLFLVMNGTLPFVNQLFDWGLNFGKWQIPVMGGYLVYPLAGYVIYHLKFTKTQKWIIYSLGILSLAVMIVGTYYASMKIDAVNTIFKGDRELLCILYSFSMFLFLKEVFLKLKKNKMILKMIEFVRPYTFSIYLLQFFVFEWMALFTNIDERSIIYRLLCPFLLSGVVMLITKVLRYFKLGKIILPN